MEGSIRDLAPPVLVESQGGLEDMLGALEGADVVAVDTEADSFYSYRDKVCLFQVTAGGEDWLVDPLADLDLGGLGDVLADPGICKVFHDAEYDVLILKREYGFTFRNLFDTRVAAAVLGSKAPGLASVLEEHFGVRLDKSQQRSDWSRRPLSDKQIAYARLDTRFLEALKEEQQAELRERDLEMIVDTECRRLEVLEAPPQEASPDDFVRVKGARTLDPKGKSALRELWAMREKQAQKVDRPPFRILGNKPMLEIARVRPRSESELLRIDGVTPKVLSRLGDRIRRALERAERKGPLRRLPRAQRPGAGPPLNEDDTELHDRLKRLRRDAAEAENIESAYLINRHVLTRLTLEKPRTMEALEDLGLLAEWQLDRFADDILDLIDDTLEEQGRDHLGRT